MNYPGKELEMFDKAYFWRNYTYLLIKKFIGKKILEVGAGIGSFTKIYIKENVNTTLSEIDNFNYETLKKTFKSQKNVKVENKLIDQFNETFDTILYLSVLEHIENDKKEITDAIEKLEYKGHLIICVPAHNYMYSNFDKEIGHFRRYEMNFFDTLNLKNANMSIAGFGRSKFYWSNLRGADLSYASLRDSHFFGVEYDDNTIFKGTWMTEIYISDGGTFFEQCKIKDRSVYISDRKNKRKAERDAIDYFTSKGAKFDD